MTAQHASDELLSARLDGALSEAESAQVAEHLMHCVECARRLALLQATSRAVSALPPAELPRTLDLSYTEQPRAQAWWNVLTRRPPAWAFAAVSAVAVVAIAVAVVSNVRPPSASTALSTSRSAAGSLGSSQFANPSPTLGQDQLKSQGLAAPVQGAPLAPAPNAAGASSAQANGASLFIQVDRQAAGAGQPVHVSVTISAGDSDRLLGPQGLQLLASSNGTETQLSELSSGGTEVLAHQTLRFEYTWSAGATTGSPAPGTYLLVARLDLAGAGTLTVSQSVTVS